MTIQDNGKTLDRQKSNYEEVQGHSKFIDSNWVDITMKSKSQSSSSIRMNSHSGVVQRKALIQSYDDNDDDDDDYDDYFDDDEEEQGLLKPIPKDTAPPFRFEVGNATYSISFPVLRTLMDEIQEIDFRPGVKVFVIVIILYVMIESVLLGHHHAGGFSGKTVTERVHMKPHGKEPISPITSYGTEQSVKEFAPGLTVSAPQTSAFKQLRNGKMGQKQYFQQNSEQKDEFQDFQQSNEHLQQNQNFQESIDYETQHENIPQNHTKSQTDVNDYWRRV